VAPPGNQAGTEKTKHPLKPQSRSDNRGWGSKNPPEGKGRQEQEMETDKGWGRVRRMKQQSLPNRVNDRCGGIEWSRHPAWTDAMREALKTRQESKGKWFSLFDRMWDRRHLQAAWERIDERVEGEARRRGAGVDGVTVETFAKRAAEEIDRLAAELKSGTYRPRPVKRHYIPKPGTTKKRPLGMPRTRQSGAGGIALAD
jgi:hypothetical protein